MVAVVVVVWSGTSNESAAVMDAVNWRNRCIISPVGGVQYCCCCGENGGDCGEYGRGMESLYIIRGSCKGCRLVSCGDWDAVTAAAVFFFFLDFNFPRRGGGGTAK